MQEHGQQTAEFSAHAAEPAAGLAGRRHGISCPDPATTSPVARTAAEIRIFAIEDGWTRIGRSVTADIRLDDPSVSRRHALIVCEPGRKARVLDDRSLNGVLLNGELVEWSRLADGDELTIGRYRLFALER